MAAEILGNGYTRQELQKDLSSGYQYVDLSYKPENTPNLLPTLPTANYGQNYPENTTADEEELSIKDEELRSSSPCIPAEVYRHLPSFLQRALTAARTDRERDILLLGILANLSGCMPNVTVSFDQRYYSPHIFLLVIASSASGKGLLTLASRLPESSTTI